MYDVMATTRVGQGRRERQARERASRERAAASSPEEDWAPDRHRTIAGEEAAELVPALGRRDPKEAYLFYDCQTDDVRLVLTVLGEAERFGAVFANGAEVVELISTDGRAAGRRLRRRRRAASGSRSAPTTSSTRPGSGPTASGPRRSSPRRRCRGSRPAAAPTSPSPWTRCPCGRPACIVPAGEERTIFALPWYGRALIGTTDSDYEGDIAHVQPSGDDIEYLLDAANAFFGTRPRRAAT